jgi:hypothetical protein
MRLARTMCAAVSRRMRSMGSTSSFSRTGNSGCTTWLWNVSQNASAVTDAPPAAAFGAGLSCCAAGAFFSAGLPPFSMKAMMSCLVTRPAWPVPSTSAMSTLCSSAIRRTSGVDLRRKRSSALSSPDAASLPASPAGCGGASDSAGSLAGAGDSAGSAFAFAGASPEGAAGFAAAAPFSVSMMATMVPTSTVSPSCTMISASVPAFGDGISASTLSVEISSSGSSRPTSSPTCFSHFETVPSAMDSPICGIGTSIRAIPHSDRK